MPSSVAAAEPHVMRLEYAQLQPGLSSLVHDIKQQGCNISFVISIFSLILSCNIFQSTARAYNLQWTDSVLPRAASPSCPSRSNSWIRSALSSDLFVREALKELKRLLELLDQLEIILESIGTLIQNQNAQYPAGDSAIPANVLRAIQTCADKVSTLESAISA